MTPRHPEGGRLDQVARKSGAVVWILRFTDEFGARKRLKLNAKTKREAQREQRLLIGRRDLAIDSMLGESSPRATVESLLPSYIEHLGRRATPTYTARAERFIALICRETSAQRLGDIRLASVDRWRNAMASEGKAPSTVNSMVGHLTAFCRWAAIQGHAAASPLVGLGRLPVERKRPRRALQEAEIAELAEALVQVDKEHASLHLALWVPTRITIFGLLVLGCRYGAMRQIAWADVDLKGRTVHLRAANVKGTRGKRRGRTIPLAKDGLGILKEARTWAAKVDGGIPSSGAIVFRSPQGKQWPAHSRNLDRYLKEALEVSGIPRVDENGEHLVLHSMRHTLVTRLLKAGTPLATVMQISGHKSVQLVTEVYGHLMHEDTRAAMDSLPELTVPEPDTGLIVGSRVVSRSSSKRRKSLKDSGSPSKTRTCDTAVNSRSGVNHGGVRDAQ